MIIFRKYNILTVDFENGTIEFGNKFNSEASVTVKYDTKEKYQKYFKSVSMANKCKMVLILSKTLNIKFALFVFYDKWNSFIVDIFYDKKIIN